MVKRFYFPLSMDRRHFPILMNGVTGRMGRTQHLIRSILAIRQQGGLKLRDGSILWPEPILLGRNELKIRALAREFDLQHWSTNLEQSLADPSVELYFDSQTTSQRTAALKLAIEAGKPIYCEKPIASDLATALSLDQLAKERGIKAGVVQDKLKHLVDSGFFGRILSVRGEFGYWVFEGDWQTAQRPSWNYRLEEEGGIMIDMFCHWRYVLDNIIAPVRSVYALGTTHIPERFDEQGISYSATADDAAYAIFELENGIIAQMNSSWCVRVYRDELLTLQVDGTHGSAVAGLHHCKTQHRVNTPKPTWNPDVPIAHNFYDDWQDVPTNTPFDNGFKAEWELFIRHLVENEPFPYSLLEGAKGVQLAELGIRSWKEQRRIAIPEISQVNR
jgi:predicted dehydrogenase